MAQATSYTVYYCIGGTENFEWKKALPVSSKKEAQEQVASLELAGYPAHYEETGRLNAVGLPTTFKAIN